MLFRSEDVPSRADAGARFGAFRAAARGGVQEDAPVQAAVADPIAGTAPTAETDHPSDRTEEDTER